MEVWIDKFITGFLASGLLSLNVMGCVQTTDEVYSQQGETWSECEGFFYDNKAMVGYCLKNFKNKTVYMMLDSTCFITEDYVTSEKNNTLKDIDSGFLHATSYKNKVIAICLNGVYSTEDFITWETISAIEETSFTDRGSACGAWKNKDALYIKSGSSLYITTDFENWTKKILSSSDGSVYITDNYLRIFSPTSENINVIDFNLNLSVETNPIASLSYSQNSRIAVNGNSIVAYSNRGLTIYSEDMSDSTEYSYFIGGSMFGQTLLYEDYIYYFYIELRNLETFAKLKRFKIDNPTEVYTYDFEIPFSSGSAYILQNDGVITAGTQEGDGGTVYASFNNGISFKKIQEVENIRYQVPVIFDRKNNVYTLPGSLIVNGYQIGNKLFVLRGCEAE